MSLKHTIFGFIFNTFSESEIENNLVSFVVDDNKSFLSNFTCIKEEFRKRGDFNFFFYNKNRLSINDLRKLSKSKYVFLNDNFLAMANMNFNPETIVTQLWHAPGAFKRFGASMAYGRREMDLIKKANEKVTFLINTSKNIIPEYGEAFQIDQSKIRPLGLPRMDYYFEEHGDPREKFDKLYPEAKGKKIILYAPTFREDRYDNCIFNHLDLDDFNGQLGEEYVLAIRFHPKFSKDIPGDNFINVSDFESEQELMLISDLLISDYSSIAIEFAALGKPVVLFVYDLDNYLANDRGFYFDLESSGLGVIARSNDELIKTIKNNEFQIDNSEFLETQFDHLDGKASERIVDLVLER